MVYGFAARTLKLLSNIRVYGMVGQGKREKKKRFLGIQGRDGQGGREQKQWAVCTFMMKHEFPGAVQCTVQVDGEG